MCQNKRVKFWWERNICMNSKNLQKAACKEKNYNLTMEKSVGYYPKQAMKGNITNNSTNQQDVSPGVISWEGHSITLWNSWRMLILHLHFKVRQTKIEGHSQNNWPVLFKNIRAENDKEGLRGCSSLEESKRATHTAWFQTGQRTGEKKSKQNTLLSQLVNFDYDLRNR